MTAWKAAGASYLKYAEVCAQAVRNVLKEEFVAAAQKRAGNEGRFSKWEAGKQLESKPLKPVKE